MTVQEKVKTPVELITDVVVTHVTHPPSTQAPGSF